MKNNGAIHLTVATIVKKQNKYLFVLERDNQQRVINQPAGHVEHNETIINACKRETKEETGINVIPSHIVGVYHYMAKNGVHYVRFAVAAQLCSPDVKLCPQDPDIEQAMWLSKRELLEQNATLRSPLVLRCIEDYEAGTQFPLTLINADYF